MKHALLILTLGAGLLFAQACNYLEVVPETKATIDDSFKSEAECQKFVNAMYGEIPLRCSHWASPDFMGGDDFFSGSKGTVYYWQWKAMVYGLESPSSSYWGYWWTGDEPELGGRRNTNDVYGAIRRCYMLLDNIDRVPGISEKNYNYWRGEALFLIAYYHHVLFEFYGPCVLVHELISANTPASELMIPRTPADECVDFICDLYDRAAELLPAKRIDAEINYATAAAAKAFKSRLLLFAASPWYNGNTEMAAFVNPDGTPLISQTYDREKWKKAMDAARDAYEYCEQNGYRLYDHEDNTIANAFQRKVTNYHDAFAKNYYNADEYIWAVRDANQIRSWIRGSIPRTPNPDGSGTYYSAGYAGYIVPSFESAETYYTENGLPWDRDPATKDSDPYQYDPATNTAAMHSHREPRFYANIGYDRGTYEAYGTSFEIHVRGGEEHGSTRNIQDEAQNCTGYFNKKFVNAANSFNTSTLVYTDYVVNFPLIRLAELYLNYAEAEFEYQGTLGAEGLACLDKVRSRAGIPAFADSWALAGGMPEGNTLREVLHTERSIEFFIEGHRYWDLRRWKTAPEVMVARRKAWNLDASDPQEFYQITTMKELMTRVWTSYWLAIPIQEININPNLVQNPGY